MAISLAQLETWSAQGSITQSKNTYAAVRKALEDSRAPYQSRDFTIFLQGSYGNDTNIYAESDVDVVIRYDGAFFHDIANRPQEERSAFETAFPGKGTYAYGDFKTHVTTALRTAFGDSVAPGRKAIQIAASGGRRKADVIVAFQFRRYFHFRVSTDESHETGMCFFAPDGTRIANYPIQHSANLTRKHQATGGNFKPIVRIFKNARSKMITDGLLAQGGAPSYYIEGLLYNVPDDRFTGGNYQDIVLKILQWLYETTHRVEFVCANEQYYLLRDNSETCWACKDGREFIDSFIRFWNAW